MIRDTQSLVRAVLHTQKPIAVFTSTSVDAAADYLRAYTQLLALDPAQLANLPLPPESTAAASAEVEYRFLSEKKHFDVTTVTFQQRAAGLPVINAGISVHLKETADRFEVICVHLSRSGSVPPAALPSLKRSLLQLPPLEEGDLTRALGLDQSEAASDGLLLSIAHQHAMICRYEADRRVRAAEEFSEADVLPAVLPPVRPEIVDGRHYAVFAIYFDLKHRDRASTHWLALIEAETRSVLYLEEFASGVKGRVFLADPMTTNGGPQPHGATSAQLNALRVWTELPNLRPANPQELIGSNVQILDIEPPVHSPPSSANGGSFDFDARSNEFAAVNAYYHCDRFFALVESLGFKRDDYFSGTRFPIDVDHRGAPRDGVTSTSAETRGRTLPGRNDTEIKMGIQNVVFALADEDNDNSPLGNACDWRVVLHELGGHGTLLNHVHSTRFLFAHSAGDSLAAILNDPESQATNKDETFPWTPYGRHHNRDTTKGWAWDGSKDDPRSDLHQEQILSTSHFRLYQAVGGSEFAPLDQRRFAARCASYLILRAIYSLTPVTNPQHASDWLCHLVVADAENWMSEGQCGGAYEKVIFWALGEQGLFGGQPPPVDVYIDDGRDGEYQYQADYAICPAIWNRRANDGLPEHEDPIPGAVNFAYVKVKNRGSSPAGSVLIDAFQNTSDVSRNYPEDWRAIQTASLPAPDLPAHSPEVVVGPFEWIPAVGDNYLMMSVSAAGDASNLRKFGPGVSIPDWRLVPYDNNIGLRKM